MSRDVMMVYIATQFSDCRQRPVKDFSTNEMLSAMQKRMEVSKKKLNKTASDSFVTFNPQTPFNKSTFTLGKNGSEAVVSVGELFPSGEFIRERIEDREFVIELERALDAVSSPDELVKQLVDDPEAKAERLEREIKEWLSRAKPKGEDVHEMLMVVHPLNDTEREILDSLEMAAILDLRDENMKMEDAV